MKKEQIEAVAAGAFYQGYMFALAQVVRLDANRLLPSEIQTLLEPELTSAKDARMKGVAEEDIKILFPDSGPKLL